MKSQGIFADVSKIDLSNWFSNDKIHMPKQHGPSFTVEPYGQQEAHKHC